MRRAETPRAVHQRWCCWSHFAVLHGSESMKPRIQIHSGEYYVLDGSTAGRQCVQHDRKAARADGAVPVDRNSREWVSCFSFGCLCLWTVSLEWQFEPRRRQGGSSTVCRDKEMHAFKIPPSSIYSASQGFHLSFLPLGVRVLIPLTRSGRPWLSPNSRCNNQRGPGWRSIS